VKRRLCKTAVGEHNSAARYESARSISSKTVAFYPTRYNAEAHSICTCSQKCPAATRYFNRTRQIAGTIRPREEARNEMQSAHRSSIEDISSRCYGDTREVRRHFPVSPLFSCVFLNDKAVNRLKRKFSC